MLYLGQCGASLSLEGGLVTVRTTPYEARQQQQQQQHAAVAA